MDKDTEENSNLSKWQRGSAALAKRIFQADVPEQFIRAIPAQSLFFVLQTNGLQSSAELLEIATIKQCRLMMDFDLWDGDQFRESTFWEWLAITDVTDDLQLLQKLFKCFDLKLVSYLISKYVAAVNSEEPTEQSPGEGYYTPDKGSTWLRVDTYSADNDFLLNRLLALIFETDADLFYQLLSIPRVATPTQLEEESYQDMLKRVQGEGVPDAEIASELRQPYALEDAQRELASTGITPSTPQDVFVVEPLVYDTSSGSTFNRLFEVIDNREQCEGELTFILNSAVVAWNIPFHKPDAVKDLVERVKGAISIGIELLEQHGSSTILEMYNHIGLQKLFRLGYTQLMQLQKICQRFTDDTLKELAQTDRDTFALIAGMREKFPCLCSIVKEHEDSGDVVTMSIDSLKQVRELKERLTNLNT